MRSIRKWSAWFLRLLAISCVSAAMARDSEWSSTLYVGRHFEVRDRDQPTKYVFNGATRVASITGSLSANQRVERLRLFAGWNLISLAVTAVDFAGQLQRNQPGAVELIYRWNPSTADYSIVSENETVSAGTVVWLKALKSGTMAVIGDYTDPSGPLFASGDNYIGGAGLESWILQLPTNSAAWSYDSELNQWHEALAVDLGFFSESTIAIPAGGAVFLRPAAPTGVEIPVPALRLHWYHEDHLGSSSVITDVDGAILKETAFYPFGSARDEYAPLQIPEPYQFTQTERDAESGLHYMEMRFLCSAVSRFTAVDFKYANPDRLSTNALDSLVRHPQMLNSYGYVENNPMRWTDPTGLDPGDPFSSADEAAKDVLKTANLMSIYFNTEYGGWIYRKGGHFYATWETEGEESGAEWKGNLRLVPSGSTIVGKYHTHGDYSVGQQVPDPDNPGQTKDIRTARTSDPKHSMFSGDEFSPPDLLNGQLNAQRFPGWTEYLGTPSGDFLKSTGRTQTTIGHSDRPFSDLPPAEAKEQLDFLSSITP